MQHVKIVRELLQRFRLLRTDRGAALLIFVMTTAVLASIGAYATLFTAANQARLGQFSQGRGDARYIAEAGVVIAMERLWRNPNYPNALCATDPPNTPRDTTEYVDINNNGVASAGDGDAVVTVTVTNCGAGRLHKITAQRVF